MWSDCDLPPGKSHVCRRSGLHFPAPQCGPRAGQCWGTLPEAHS
uniref:Uncharacterized protein n=1 Tax=Anguilla anguilla TaxID=7936 RepID=A0A0E9PP37_ANGAN